VIEDILKFSIEIALEAGKILMKGFRSPDTEISFKSRTNLVTNIDRESEIHLFQRVRATFPNHAIVAEEGNLHETNDDYIWFIDPLDATNNYAHGLPYFCVSIGVYSKSEKRMITGVVYNPYLGEMFFASRGGGSFLNNELIKVSETRDIGISVLATGFPYDKENHEKNNLMQFNKFLPRIQGIRRMGSAAIDLCYVACGRLDGYWEPELCSWDMAAGSIIVEEAGGVVTKYDGSIFDQDIAEIVASNGIIHNQMISVLNERME